jgi:hypothetical protein
MSDRTSITASVTGIVHDSSGKLASADYDRIVAAAIARYSKDRPDISVVDLTGNAGHDYDLPSGWIDEFSDVVSIEYPMGQIPTAFINDDIDDAWTIYQTPTGKKLRLIYAAPAASQQFRVTFTVSRTDATIPDSDVDALCNLAASFCLEELANLYAQTSDPMINADVVNYRTKSQEFAARAKRLIQLYKEHLGIKDTDITPPASGVISMEENYPVGIDRLTHPRWARRRR